MRKGSNRLKGNSVIRRFFRESLFTDGSAACNYRRWIFKEKDMGLEEKVFERKNRISRNWRSSGFRRTKKGTIIPSYLWMEISGRIFLSALKGTFSGAFSIRRRERSICPSMCPIRRGLCEYGQVVMWKYWKR